MKGFYDNMVPKAMNKLGKPFGSKVEVINMGDVGEVMSLPVTDAMRESARGGFPLFRKTPALSAMDQALDNAKSEKERHGIIKEMLVEIEVFAPVYHRERGNEEPKGLIQKAP